MVYNVTDYLEYFSYDEYNKSITISTAIDTDHYENISKVDFNPPVEYNKYITCDFTYGIFRTEDTSGNIKNLTTKEKIDLIRYINVKYRELEFLVHLHCYDNITGVIYRKSFNEIEKEELIPIVLPSTSKHLKGVLKYFPSTREVSEAKYAITDDGRLAYNITDVCSSCLLYLTEEEFKTFPKPDERYKAYQRYDFRSNTWKDSRSVDDIIKEYHRLIDFEFNNLIKENAKFYLNNDIEYSTFSDVTSLSEQIDYVKDSTIELLKSFHMDDDVDAMNACTNVESDNLISYKKANSVVYGHYLVWKNYPLLKALSSREDYLKLMDKFEEWLHKVYY